MDRHVAAFSGGEAWGRTAITNPELQQPEGHHPHRQDMSGKVSSAAGHASVTH
ncbi:MAG: hypothetical protein ACXVGC_12090 [Mycobacteriaceae bacterium]